MTPAWRGLSLLLFAALVGCVNAPGEDATLDRAPVTTRKLKPSGRNLLDEHGRIVELRGFNAGGRAKMPPYAPFDITSAPFATQADNYFAAFQKLGANAVRLTLAWEALEPTKGTYDMDYWGRYRTLVDSAYAHGLAVLVDAHQDVYASPFCGDGFPIWTLGPITHGDPNYTCGSTNWSFPYFNPMSTVNQAFQRFWDDADGIQTSFAAMWTFVAKDLSTHPGVAGYEMLNEPGPGSGDPSTFEATSLPPFFLKMGTTIRAAAGDVAVFGGAVAGDSSAMHHLIAPNLPGFVFAPHYYDAEAFIDVDDVSIDRIRTGIQQTVALPGSPNIPVVIGEWGMPNSNTAKAAYNEVMLQVFDENQLSAIVWDGHMSDTKWNSEDFTVFRGDGTEQAWASSVVRPYPRAVAGASFTHVFDPKGVTFSLQVTGAGSGVTEVYVPERIFGAAPHIVATGARWHWLPNVETLVLAGSAGKNYRVDVSK